MYVTLSSESTAANQTLAPSLIFQAPAPQQQQRSYATGTHLFHEGDTANHVYEVKTGVLRLTRVLENGRRQVIAFGLPGDIIGFPNGDAHHTDCDVVATAEIVAHRRSTLETGAGDPETHQRLLHAALREISAMQDHFMMLARKSASEKVASFLLAISNRTGSPRGNFTTFSLPMSRADIADFLGLTVETVSRTFSILRKDGIISLETPQTVLVLDMEALLDASQTDD
ncbi:helix-turn-helix domain-containing protein [Sulfitobacter sp. AS59]|jgi:CRP-like cAMP-binding protein|uniref:helix-turn-helix domain-containing protein n=1 Tax=Sulfitobacter sp. AS59 TaxID=3135784 RepID=UPI003175A518